MASSSQALVTASTNSVGTLVGYTAWRACWRASGRTSRLEREIARDNYTREVRELRLSGEYVAYVLRSDPHAGRLYYNEAVRTVNLRTGKTDRPPVLRRRIDELALDSAGHVAWIEVRDGDTAAVCLRARQRLQLDYSRNHRAFSGLRFAGAKVLWRSLGRLKRRAI